MKKNQNLRDHMSDLELIFTMLGERVTTEISQKEKPDTFIENKQVAQRGGNVAGVAREQAEKRIRGEVLYLIRIFCLVLNWIQVNLNCLSILMTNRG